MEITMRTSAQYAYRPTLFIISLKFPMELNLNQRVEPLTPLSIRQHHDEYILVSRFPFVINYVKIRVPS
jgi:hypothetical protein